MTTYPLTWPSSISVNSMQITPTNSVAVTQSPFSFSQKTYDNGGEMWQASVSIPPLTRDQAEDFICFLTLLKGSYGTFLMPVFDAKAARGSWGGTPLIAGAGQTGNDLNIDGGTTGTTDYAKAGDWVQIGTGSSTKLFKVMADADTDGSGATTLNLFPSIKVAFADNTALTVVNPHGLFRLDGDFTYNVDINKFYSIQLSMYEAL